MEFPELGDHCSKEECNQLDFLPLRCNYCNQFFCTDHVKQKAHDCPVDAKDEHVVTPCPLCGQSIHILPGEDLEIKVAEHTNEGCPNITAAPIHHACNLEGCSKREVISVRCSDCGSTYCLAHRFARDHACEGPKMRESGAGPSAPPSERVLAGAIGSGPFKIVVPPNQQDLKTFIDTAHVSALNYNESVEPKSVFTGGRTALASDCDEQLLLEVPFKQPVKLHSFRIRGPGNGGAPCVVRLFTNKRNMEFDEAEESAAVQDIQLTKDQALGRELVELRYVKFQNVTSVTIFVESNFGDVDVTEIEHIVFYGTPFRGGADVSKIKKVGS